MFYCQGGSDWLQNAEPAAVEHMSNIYPLHTKGNLNTGTEGCKIFKLDKKHKGMRKDCIPMKRLRNKEQLKRDRLVAIITLESNWDSTEIYTWTQTAVHRLTLIHCQWEVWTPGKQTFFFFF